MWKLLNDHYEIGSAWYLAFCCSSAMKSHPRDTQEMKNLLREHTCH
ncbi:MAG: hypothetical protein ACI90C_000404, partial [Rhodoferax sp.]